MYGEGGVEDTNKQKQKRSGRELREKEKEKEQETEAGRVWMLVEPLGCVVQEIIWDLDFAALPCSLSGCGGGCEVVQRYAWLAVLGVGGGGRCGGCVVAF